ncbi:MAG: hypothetical protein CMP23_10600 [Rickettsiales bacterium]|nr:hypothetical protein [Rickettsiales bacterium]
MTNTRFFLLLSVTLLCSGLVALEGRADDEGLDEALDALGITAPEDAEQAADIYSVVPGDTLWHICERFFGDPDYWPTLWSINNAEITNPHYIYPGQALQFQPGTDLRPPSLLVAGDAEVIDDLSFDENFEPIVHFLSTTQDCALPVPFTSNMDWDIALAAPSFMTRSPLEPLGVVESAVPKRELLSDGDTVYLRFRNLSDVNCGDIYTLYHYVKKVRHPKVVTARLGHSYQVSAEVLVTDVGPKWVTATVVQSFGEFPRGELVTDRIPVTGKVRTLQLDNQIDGFIIDKTHQENLLFQSNQLIYIDRGRSDGVQSGTIFWVLRRGDGLTHLSQRVDNSLPDRVIGRLVVFAADEYVSTAVLTDQAVSVEVGDRITSRLD